LPDLDGVINQPDPQSRVSGISWNPTKKQAQQTSVNDHIARIAKICTWAKHALATIAQLFFPMTLPRPWLVAAFAP
jgi:hypothetical protein